MYLDTGASYQELKLSPTHAKLRQQTVLHQYHLNYNSCIFFERLLQVVCPELCPQ